MKKLLLRIMIVLFTVAPDAFSQAVVSSAGLYNFGVVTTTGQLGSYLTYSGVTAPPSNYTIDWSNPGTAPSACTFQVEGSSDGVHWYGLTGATNCTAPSMFHIISKPVELVRIDVLTYTAGDGTTAVNFNYTRGVQ